MDFYHKLYILTEHWESEKVVEIEQGNILYWVTGVSAIDWQMRF